MNADKLKRALELHAQWLSDGKGERANLGHVNLCGANLRGADLRWADLSYAGLRYASMRGADLRWADLSYADLRGADLRAADLSGADLRWANLSGADLRRANLSRTDIQGCVGDGKEIRSMRTGHWAVVFTHDTMAIGCQQHKIADWFAFDDETINAMDIHALEWWRKWRDVLKTIIEVAE